MLSFVPLGPLSRSWTRSSLIELLRIFYCPVVVDSSWNLLVIGPHVDWIRNNKKCVYTILFYSISGVKIEGAKNGWNCKISALALFFFGLPSKKPLASRHKKSLYSKIFHTTKQDLGMKPTASGRICIQYFHSKKSFQTSPAISDCSILKQWTGLNFSLSFRRLTCAKKTLKRTP